MKPEFLTVTKVEKKPIEFFKVLNEGVSAYSPHLIVNPSCKPSMFKSITLIVSRDEYDVMYAVGRDGLEVYIGKFNDGVF